MRKNFSELVATLQTHNIWPDVIVLTETWIFDCETSHYSLNNYHSLFCCNNGYRSGGIAIFCKNNVTAQQCKPPSVHNNNIKTADILKVNLEAAGLKITVIAIYRFHSFTVTDFNTELTLWLPNINCRNLVIVGDLNIDLHSQCPQVEDYKNLMNNQGLAPMINSATRVTESSSTLIDHMYVRAPGILLDAAVVDLQITDHRMIAIAIARKPVHRIEPGTIYHKTDRQIFATLAGQLDWNLPFHTNDVDLVYNAFETKLLETMELSKVAKRVPRANCGKPWLSANVKALIQEKYQLIRNKSTLSDVEKDRLRYLVKNLKIFIENDKRTYFESKFAEAHGDSRRLQQVINEATGKIKLKQDCSMLNVQGRIVTNPIEAANELNKYFVNAARNLTADLPVIPRNHPVLARFNTTSSLNSMYLREVTEPEIALHLSKLKNSKAPGEDGVTSELLKCITHIVSPILAQLINLSFETGTFPTSLKHAIITPIYKGKGEKTFAENYRPISLLKICSKLHEKVMADRLINFLDSKTWLSEKQYGFREGKSTEDALLLFSSEINRGLNLGKKVASIQIDLARAFECAPSDGLLETLEAAGVRGTALQWFRSYLEGRTQQVKPGNLRLPLEIGCVQGGTLSPLLFIMYLNELCQHTFEGTLIAYADDICLIYVDDSWESIERKMNEDLHILKAWFYSKKLVLNVNKSNYMVYCLQQNTRRIDLTVKAHQPECTRVNPCICPALERVPSVKYLGITFQSTMKFNKQVSEINKFSRNFLRQMFYLRNICPLPIQKMLYQSLCESKISYGISVWGGTFNTTINCLSVTQKYIMRTMARKNRLEPSAPIFVNFALLPIRHLYAYKTLRAFFNRSGQYRAPVPQDGTRVTRQASQQLLMRPLHPLRSAFQKTFDYLAPKMFNELPAQIKQSSTTRRFGNGVKNWLLGDGFETIKRLFTSST